MKGVSLARYEDTNLTSATDVRVWNSSTVLYILCHVVLNLLFN